MKKSLPPIFFLLFLSFSGVSHGWEIKFYRDLGRTTAHSYYYEGIWPLLKRRKKDHYAIQYDQRLFPMRITHYNKKGKISNNEMGWALFKLQYDKKGRLIQATFFDKKGKYAFNKDLGFAREIRRQTPKYRQLFFDHTGSKILANPQWHFRKSFKALSP